MLCFTKHETEFIESSSLTFWSIRKTLLYSSQITMRPHLYLQALYQRFYSLVTESPPFLPFVPIRVVVWLPQTVAISAHTRLTAFAPLTIDNHRAFSPNPWPSSQYILNTLPSKFNHIQPNKARRKRISESLYTFAYLRSFKSISSITRNVK